MTPPSSKYSAALSHTDTEEPVMHTTALPERFLSVDEVSAILGVPVETLYGWRKKRTGPRAALVGRHLRYDPADVRAWFDAQADKEA